MLVTETWSPANKKRFQVIWFPALLSAGMHGTEHCNRGAERFASRLPNGRFRHPPDQCLLARRLLFPIGTGRS